MQKVRRFCERKIEVLKFLLKKNDWLLTKDVAKGVGISLDNASQILRRLWKYKLVDRVRVIGWQKRFKYRISKRGRQYLEYKLEKAVK